MGKIGNLWFDVGLHDVTDKDYEAIRRKLKEGFKNPVEVKVNVDTNVFSKPREEANRLLQSVTKVQSAMDRLATLESRVQMGMRFGGSGYGYDRALQQIGKLREALRKLDTEDANAVRAATGSGFTKQLNEIRMLIQEQDKLNKLQERNNRLKWTNSQSGMRRDIEATNAALSRQGRLAGEVRNELNNYLSVYAAERFLRNVIEIGGEFEKQRIALRSILGDATQAETIFSQIKTLAVESPFQFQELTSYAKQLSAFSIPYEELYDTTKRLADISAGLGVDMGRIILAYGQVRSAAFLRGQELRQFTEAGIPLVDELAKKFSQLEGQVVSAADVFDRISRRMVSFEMVKEVLWDLTVEGGKFFQMQEELAESLAGKWSNLGDSFQIMLADIAEGNNTALKGGIELLTSLMNNWRKVGAAVAGVVMIYGGYRAALVIQNVLTAASVIHQTNLARAAAVATAALKGQAGAINVVNASTAQMITRLNGAKAAFVGIGKAGWWGIAAGVVAGLVTYIGTAVREANKLNRELEEIAGSAQSSASVEAAGFKGLVSQLKEANAGSRERAGLIEKINSRYGEYLPNLLTEADSYEKVAGSIDEVTEAIRRKNQEQAYEQGLGKISETYTKEYADLQEVMEKHARRLYGFENGEEKNFVKDYIYQIKELGKTSDEAFDSLEKLYGVSSSRGERGKLYVDTHDYTKLTRDEDAAIRGLQDSLNQQFEGIEVLAPQLKTIQETFAGMKNEFANTPELERAFDLSEAQAELDYLEEMGVKGGAYVDKLRAKIAELSQEAAGWIKEAERIAGTEKSGLFNFLLPKDEERQDILKYIDRLAEEYGNLKKELGERVSLRTEDEGNKQYISDLKRQLEAMETMGKVMKVDWGSYAKGGDDSIAEAWKERLKLMKEAMSLYEKFAQLEGTDKAGKRVGGMDAYKGLFSGGVSESSYRDELEKMYKSFRSTGNREGMAEVVKLITELDENSLKNSLSRMKSEIDRTTKQWDLFQQLFDLTGDREVSMRATFGDEMGFKDKAEQLRGMLEKELSGSGIGVDVLLGMDRGKVQEQFGGAVAELAKSLREEVEKTNEEDLLDTAKLISKYKGYEEQIVEIKRKANEDIQKLEEQRATFGNEMTDKAIAERRNEERKDVLETRFEQFKESPEYLRAFDDLAGVSAETLEYLLGRLKEFKGEAAAAFDVEGMREYAKLIEDIEDALADKNLFEAFRESMKEAAEARKKWQQAQNVYQFVQQGGKMPDGSGGFVTEEDALRRVNAAYDEYLSKKGKAIELGNKLADTFIDLFSTISSLGDSVGGVFGEVVSGIAEISNTAIQAGKDVASLVKDIGKLAGEKSKVGKFLSSGAGAGLTTGLGVVVGAAILGISVLNGLSKAWQEQARLEEERLRTINATLDDYRRNLIETKLELKDDWGTNGFNNILQTIDALNEAKAQYNEQINRTDPKFQNGPGGMLKSGIYDQLGISKKEIDQMEYITKKASKGFLGIGGNHTKTMKLTDWVRENMGEELFNADGRLNLEVAEALLENADNLYGDTADILRNLADQEELIREAEEQFRNSVYEMFGSYGDELSDAMVNAFRNGESAAEDMKNVLNGIVENFAVEMAKSIFLQPLLQSYADRFMAATEDYHDDLNRARDSKKFLSDFRKEIAEKKYQNEILDITEDFFDGLSSTEEGFNDFLKAWQDAAGDSGFNIFQPDKEEGSTALRGSVQNITEDTADLLASYVNAIRADVSVIRIDWDKFVNDILPRHTVVLQAQLAQLKAIASNTGRNAELVSDIYDILKGNISGTNRFNV